ncbi:D-serine ammonia-lyase [Arthrobacter sp. UM1]|nr:D-serine ammonia-lyase [Arthrobacter sp. UM1]
MNIRPEDIRPERPDEHGAAVLEDLRAARPTLWVPDRSADQAPSGTEKGAPGQEPATGARAANPVPGPAAEPAPAGSPISPEALEEARARFEWFAPLVERIWPETAPSAGVIESRLVHTPALREALQRETDAELGPLWAKCDNELPVTASVKSRGGINAVFAFAQRVLEESGIGLERGPLVFLEDGVREAMSRRTIAVGSTGNLGLSIGLAGRALGFRVQVHMSEDAKAWKKERLRAQGAEVIEHAGRFSTAVTEAREASAQDPSSFFIDDEQSSDLFLGYAVAARRLAGQLEALSVPVTADRPLFLYLPCGVGGSPGGIAYGATRLFGDRVRCVFVEPTHAPSVLLGTLTGLHERVHVADIGLDGLTEADGLAVQRPSALVGREVGGQVSAFATADDGDLVRALALAHSSEGLRAEPSAAAGLVAASSLARAEDGTLARAGISREQIRRGTHVAWLTGGAMMPDAEFGQLLRRGGRP